MNLPKSKQHHLTKASWKAMRARCERPKHRGHKDYGAKGVTVCPEWRDSFQAFVDHVGLRPSKAHTLDRIKNNRGYEPGNVRWATYAEQHRNRTNNVHLTLDGRTMILKDWAKEVGLTGVGIKYRLDQGWTVRDALMTPARGGDLTRGGRTLTHKGKTLTVTQWAREVGLNKATLQVRLRNGWTTALALETPARPKAG